jgi:sugar O-acyltransferase (sialic acid O-acetyltransferase NeuD family)
MRLVIFGTGGMGREAADLARRSEAVRARYAAIAFAADAIDGPVDGLPVLRPGEIRDEDEICLAIGSGADRRRLAARFDGHLFARLAAATAIVSPSTRLGAGLLLCDYALVNNGVVIGDHFQGNVFAQVSHDCRIGDFVTFGPRVSCNGSVEIGSDVTVGAGAVIRNGRPDRPLHIGDGAVIGMGAVVVSDVAAGSVVFASPARPRPAKARADRA